MDICAIDGCKQPAIAHTSVVVGECQQATTTLPLCRYHVYDIATEQDDPAAYVCPDCGGPVRPEHGTVTQHGHTFQTAYYYCAGTCNAGWHEDIMADELRTRMDAAYEAAQCAAR